MSWSYFTNGLDKTDPDAQQKAKDRVANLREDGWKCRWGWDSKAPFDTENGIPFDGLLDHLYRLVKPDGQTIYVSEPYWLYDFDKLAELEGWDIDASSTLALWYPGHTIAIRFRRV